MSYYKSPAHSPPPPLPLRSSRPGDCMQMSAVPPYGFGKPPPLPARPSVSESSPEQFITKASGDFAQADSAGPPLAGAIYPPGQWPTPELPPFPVGRFTVLGTSHGPLNSATIQTALQGLGSNATLFLPPASVWDLEAPIQLLEWQTLATWGFPTDERSMAMLRAGPTCLPNVIRAGRVSGARLRNVIVDGGRNIYGFEPKADVMLQFGNSSVDQVVDHCIIRNPRSWSCLQGFEGCTNFRVTNNIIGPAGTGADKAQGQWADGISYAGTNGLIAGNLIFDATDGGIVVFGANGTLVISNTVISQNSLALGGINMVDYDPLAGNYVGTRVLHNTIKTVGPHGYFKTGLGQGPGVWWTDNPPDKINRGAVVMNNLIDAENQPQNQGTFGYGFAVARDIIDWVCVGNVSSPRVVYEGDITASLPTPNVTPGPFVHDVSPDNLVFAPTAMVNVKDSQPHGKGVILQPEFRYARGRISSLISIVPGASRILTYNGGQFQLQRGSQVFLKTITLIYGQDNIVRIQQRGGRHNGQIEWQGGPGPNAAGGLLKYTTGGKLCITSGDGQGSDICYDFTPHLPQSVVPGREIAPLIISDSMPHISVATSGESILFASDYVFCINRGFKVGQIISRSCVYGDDPNPWTLIYTLNPYGQFVALRSKQRAAMIPSLPLVWPDPSQEGSWDWEVVWSTPNGRCPDKDTKGVMFFQGDGNLVIYLSNGQVPWASGTSNRTPAATYLRLGLGTAQSPWIEIDDTNGNRVWNS